MKFAELKASEVNRSLLTEMTTFGVDDWLFVLNLEVFLVMAVGLRIYMWLGVAIALHFALVAVSRVQPRILLVYVKYLRQEPRYSTWLCIDLRRGARPALLEQY